MSSLFGAVASVWRRIFGRPQTSPTTHSSHLEGSGDIIIVIIGPTGSGKSTLINSIVGAEVAPVGHGLSTCTQQVKEYRHKLAEDSEVFPGRTVVLVDTPGFDDTAMHDSTRVFKGVAQWIAEYPKRQDPSTNGKHNPPQIAGFVYLQDISQKRINNRQNIDFSRLQQLGDVGSESSYSKLFLVTYQWPSKPSESSSPSTAAGITTTTTTAATNRGSAPLSLVYQQAEDREKELQDKFWKDLLAKGARMSRVEGSDRTSQQLVREILKSLSSSP